MLYRYDSTNNELDALAPIEAHVAGIAEKQIELAVATKPEAIFRSSTSGPPVLVVKTSVRGQKMPDIVALDSEGRLVLVECKRGWANRDALAQLLDYATDYADDALIRLQQDWRSGRGDGESELIEAFRQFADDPEYDPDELARDQVLVVVAAGKDDGFDKITRYLARRGVPVYFVQVRLYRRATGELYLDVEPVELAPAGEATAPATAERVWLVNTDETHSSGAWERFLARGVAAIWGYEDGPATLQKGAQRGDVIYAYLNGRGVVAKGAVNTGEVYRASRDRSVFPECKDDNEWHLDVEWEQPPDGTPVTNREVRRQAGAGLPVRNTFCRLWNPKVRAVLASRCG